MNVTWTKLARQWPPMNCRVLLKDERGQVFFGTLVDNSIMGWMFSCGNGQYFTAPEAVKYWAIAPH